jgi:hypothetical protein
LLVSTAGAALAQDRPGEVDAVQRTRRQIAELRRSLEEIRGEKLRTEVDVKFAPEDAKEESVDLDRRYRTRSAQIARAYARIGIFPKDYQLGQFMKAFSSQVLAYYEPKKHTFFIVKSNLIGTAEDSTAIHELHHALQDQRFDLDAYYDFSRDPDPIATNDDGLLARRLVVEGEASLVATLYDARKEKTPEERVSEFLEKRAAMSREELSRLERKHAAQAEGGKNLLKALNASDSLPHYLYRQMIDPYLQGAAIVARVRKQGGWKAVDDLFKNPPASTKQLYHLDKLRAAPDRVELDDLAAAIGGGFKRTVENTLGEPGVACVLEARALSRKIPETAARIAARWAGDRFQAYENAAGETSAVWLTSWEDEAAATDFEAGCKEMLKSESGTTTISFVERRGPRVLLVLGAPRRKMKALIQATLDKKE